MSESDREMKPASRDHLNVRRHGNPVLLAALRATVEVRERFQGTVPGPENPLDQVQPLPRASRAPQRATGIEANRDACLARDFRGVIIPSSDLTARDGEVAFHGG